VALKFIRSKEHYDREVNVRARCGFDGRYVLLLTANYDGDIDVEFRTDAIRKGYEEFPYCVVMEAGSRSLKHMVDKQYIAGVEWDTIRGISKQIATALLHVHQKGVVHGDLKGSYDY